MWKKIFIGIIYIFFGWNIVLSNPLLFNIDKDSLISVKNNEATRLYKQGLYYESEDILKEVLDLKKLYNADNLKSLANTYSNLGILSKRTFRTDLALDYYDKAEMIYKKSKDALSRLVAVYYNKATLYYTNEDYYKAERYVNEAKAILDTIPIPQFINMALLYSLNSSIELKKGNEEKALRNFRIAEARYSDDPNTKLFIYDLIIHAYLIKDEIEVNQDKILNYLKLFKKNIDLTKNKKRLITYYLYKGLFYYKLDPNNNNTFSSYLNALEILRENFGNRHPLYNSVYIYIIRYLFNEGNYLLTLDYVQKAFENLSHGFKTDRNYDNPDPTSFNDYDPVFIHLTYKIQSLLHLYKEDDNIKFLLLAKQNADYTLHLIEKLKWKYDHENHKYYISEAETEIFKIAEKINYDLYLLTGEQQYRNKAFELNERSKAFSLLINLRTEQAMKFGGIPSELIDQENKIIQKISAFTEFVLEEENLENPDRNKIKNWENALFRLNQEHDQLIEFFENNYPDYYRLKYDTRVMSSREVQKELGRNEVLLEYSLTDSILFTYVISHEKTELLQQKIDTGFRRLCLDYYNVITDQSFSYGVRETFKQYVEKGHELYKILILPIAESIEEKKYYPGS